MKKLITYILLIIVSLNFKAQSWQRLTIGLDGGMSVYPVYPRCLTVYNSKLIVGGIFTSAGGINTDNIAAWDGNSWSTFNTGLQDLVTGVNAIVVYNGDLYAGGNFTAASSTTLCGLARWNGTTWSSVASNISSSTNFVTINAFAIYNNNLYAAGEFTNIGGTVASNIAKWNGTTWSALGTGIQGGQDVVHWGTVRTLQVFNNELYAGGTFTNAGGIPAKNIAKWNGTSWAALGTGINTGTIGWGVTYFRLGWYKLVICWWIVH
jgi:hypothetical protein